MSMLLGEFVSQALAKVGVTPEKVSSWLGRPCGCKERKEKLNDLHRWARAVFSGGKDVEGGKAVGWLEGIIGEKEQQ